MADNRAELVLDGNITPLRQKLREGAAELRRFGDEGSRSVTALNSSMGQLQQKMVAIGAAITAFSFAGSIKSTIDQTDALNDMHQRTGIAIETLARLSYAGKQSGTDIGAIGDSAKKLSKLMLEAAAGNKDATRTLTAFGVSLEQIKRSDVEGALRNIADTIKSLPEHARQGALESMARGMGELVPLLQDGSAGLEEMFQQADKLRITDGYTVAAQGAGDLNDSLDRLKDTMTGVAQRAVAGVLPSLTDVVDEVGQLTLAAEDNQSALRTLGTVTMGAILTNALRSLAVDLKDATSNWLSNMQATRQNAAAQVASATTTATSAAAVKAHAAMLYADAEASVASASGMARLAAIQSTLLPARQRLTAATEAAIVAEKALAAAKTEAAAKTTLTGVALNAMGGPLGAIVTLIGIGATAWATFGRDGVAAVSSVTQEIERGREVLARFQREQKYGSGDEGQLRASLEAIEGRIAVLVQSSAGSQAAAAELSKLRAEAESLQGALDGIQSARQKTAAGSSDKALRDLQDRLKSPDDKGDKSRMQQYEAELAEKKRISSEENALREYTKAEELAYWQQLQKSANVYAKDRIAIAKKVADLTVAARREEAKEQQAVDVEMVRSREAMALLDIEAAKAAAQASLESGSTTKQQFLSMEIEFEQQRLAVQRTALEDRLRLLEADPNTNPVEFARIKNQILELDRQHQVRTLNLYSQVAKESNQIWESLGQSMTSLWDKGVQALMNGTFTWRNAFKAVGAELVSWFATQVVGKQVASWLAGQARMFAIRMGFLVQEQTAQAASSAVIVASKTTEAGSVIAANAAEAGAGAAASQASIPFAGPVLALAAMAAVFAAVSAMSGKVKSAAGGYDIPKGLNPMVQTHEEEMILPKQYANVIRGLAAGSGEGGGGGDKGGDVVFYGRGGDWVHKDDLAKMMRKLNRNFVTVKK